MRCLDSAASLEQPDRHEWRYSPTYPGLVNLFFSLLTTVVTVKKIGLQGVANNRGDLGTSRWLGNVELLTCEQSTALMPRVSSGDLDLALVSRDDSRRGAFLFQETMVWVGWPNLSCGAEIRCLPLFMIPPDAWRGAVLLKRSTRRGWFKEVYDSSSRSDCCS